MASSTVQDRAVLKGGMTELEAVSQQLGLPASRIHACLRFVVASGVGAFTLHEWLKQGSRDTVRWVAISPAGGVLEAVRGEGGNAQPCQLINEAVLPGEGSHDIGCLLNDEAGGGVVVSLAGAWQVHIIRPGGRVGELPLERDDARHHAEASGLAPGEYILAFLHFEEGQSIAA